MSPADDAIDALSGALTGDQTAAAELPALLRRALGLPIAVSYRYGRTVQIHATGPLSAVKALARTYDQLTEQEGGPPNEQIGEPVTASGYVDLDAKYATGTPASNRLVAESRRIMAQPPADGEGDAEVWIPPRSDCMERRPDKPCSHCGGLMFHHRTRRCGDCGRRP